MAVADKVQANYKIQLDTKRRVDLMANVLGVDKSAIIDEAVALLVSQRGQEVNAYLQEVRASLAGTGPLSPGELFTGRRRKGGYAGGAAD